MTIRNITINGYGWLRFFWYIYFEILSRLSKKPVVIKGCVFKNFYIRYEWETKFELVKQLLKEPDFIN